MGAVYEAMQEQPRRRVALKIMKTGVTSRSAQRRFEFESQLLARLHHPGIAQVFEAGTHDDGRGGVPYFAMEYIPSARTLTSYARSEKLGTRERLLLFQKVCDAVQHGHLKGIIHRDLKPANILVDGNGQPKIIDFGVARCTDSDLAVTTLQTDVGQLLGTLQYMSPEQFQADPADIDTRSDIYALGVVMYELLAEVLPYDVKNLALHEIARAVKEDDPARLSSVNRMLRGDIEIIASKSLEKKRERRYQSVASLSDDIERYLSNEPITARRASILDLSMKWIRRHQMAAVVLLLLCILLPPALAMGWGWLSTREAYRELDKINESLIVARKNEQLSLLQRIVQGEQGQRVLSDLLHDSDIFPDISMLSSSDERESAVIIDFSGVIGVGLVGSYDAILADNLNSLLADIGRQYPAVRTVILRINSGGGVVDGMLELTQLIEKYRGRFHFVGLVDEAISAALQVAVSCDQILALPGGVLGSVSIYAGDLPGTFFEVLQDEVAARLSRHVNVSGSSNRALANYLMSTNHELWYQEKTGILSNNPDQTEGEWILVGTKSSQVLDANDLVLVGLADAVIESEESLADSLKGNPVIYSGQGALAARQRSHVWTIDGQRLDYVLSTLIDRIYELSDPSVVESGFDSIQDQVADLRIQCSRIRSAYDRQVMLDSWSDDNVRAKMGDAADAVMGPYDDSCPLPLQCLLDAVDIFTGSIEGPKLDPGRIVPYSEAAQRLRASLEECLVDAK